MTCKLVESPIASKDTVLRNVWIFAPSEGPKFLFLSIIDKIYKTASRILLLRKVYHPDYSGIVAFIRYISFVPKGSKEN